MFAPYIQAGGTFFMGIFNPDTTASSTTTEAFMYGFGANFKAGIDLGNAIFVEYFIRMYSSADAKFDVKDSNDTTTGHINYHFVLDSSGICFGFRF
jgi:hypothetical protein